MARTTTNLLSLLEQLETDATLYLEHKEIAMITELCRTARPLFRQRLSSTRALHVLIMIADAEHLCDLDLAELSNSCIAHHDLTRLLLRSRKETRRNTLRLLRASDSEAEESRSSSTSQNEAELWRAFFEARGPFRSFNRSR